MHPARMPCADHDKAAIAVPFRNKFDILEIATIISLLQLKSSFRFANKLFGGVLRYYNGNSIHAQNPASQQCH